MGHASRRIACLSFVVGFQHVCIGRWRRCPYIMQGISGSGRGGGGGDLKSIQLKRQN